MRSIPLSAALLLLAGHALAADKMAILMPRSSFQTLSGQVNLGTGTTSIEEAAGRVLPKLVKDAAPKAKWKDIELVPFEDAKAAGAAEAAGMVDSASGRVRYADAVAKRLGVRYVVTSEVRELTSYRAASFPVARKGGRATIALLVYDAQEKKYVYEDTKTATSVHAAYTLNDSLKSIQDQALLNAYMQALEPFVKKGARKEVTTASQKLVGTVKSVAKGGKVLLDLGTASGVRVGDTLASLDGSVKLRVVEVLENGSIADVIEGKPEKDMAVRSID